MNIITKIEIQKKNKDRVNIFIDEEYAFSLSTEVLYKEGLKVKETVDYERLKEVSKEDNYMKCKNSALKIIERNYKTKKEIVDKLLQKEFEKDTINRVIKFLEEYNFLNDDNYAKMYVSDKKKNQGQRKIKYDLIRKGIDENTIEEELSSISDGDQFDSAYELGRKKYNTIIKRENDKFKLSQKLYRFLISKGFSYDIVSRVVKELTNSELE